MYDLYAKLKDDDNEIMLLLESILDNPISYDFDYVTLYKISKYANILKNRLGYEELEQ